jgi:hypothetical protein
MNEACKTSGTMKRQNLRIMGIEGEEIQTKGTYNLVNRIIAKVSYPWERESYLGAGCLQNTKPLGPKKKNSQTYCNPNTQYSEQIKNTESWKRKKINHM